MAFIACLSEHSIMCGESLYVAVKHMWNSEHHNDVDVV